jgi:sec-independent protein translocase protein TatA
VGYGYSLILINPFIKESKNMGAFGIWQWIVILLIVLILFARPGKISGIMGDFGKGMRNFKSGLKDDKAVEEDDAEDVEVIEAVPAKKRAAKKRKAVKKKAVKKAARKTKAKS